MHPGCPSVGRHCKQLNHTQRIVEMDETGVFVCFNMHGFGRFIFNPIDDHHVICFSHAKLLFAFCLLLAFFWTTEPNLNQISDSQFGMTKLVVILLQVVIFTTLMSRNWASLFGPLHPSSCVWWNTFENKWCVWIVVFCCDSSFLFVLGQ